MDKKGNFKLLDKKCDSKEKLLSWNIIGPKGDKGEIGSTGPKGEPGKDFVIPEPKTIKFADNLLIKSDLNPDLEINSEWLDVSGGYNQIAVNVEKTGGIDSSYIRSVYLEFTNNPSINELVGYYKLDCTQNNCLVIVFPVLAKYYRMKFNTNSGLTISSNGYLSNK